VDGPQDRVRPTGSGQLYDQDSFETGVVGLDREGRAGIEGACQSGETLALAVVDFQQQVGPPGQAWPGLAQEALDEVSPLRTAKEGQVGLELGNVAG
jgi:hypothetical protein